jgi:hypothetical protein
MMPASNTATGEHNHSMDSEHAGQMAALHDMGKFVHVPPETPFVPKSSDYSYLELSDCPGHPGHVYYHHGSSKDHKSTSAADSAHGLTDLGEPHDHRACSCVDGSPINSLPSQLSPVGTNFPPFTETLSSPVCTWVSPSSPAFEPNSPAYTPASPAYSHFNPRSPVNEAPSSPAYTPASPAYPHFNPRSPVDEMLVSPASPSFSRPAAPSTGWEGDSVMSFEFSDDEGDVISGTGTQASDFELVEESDSDF